jgi:antibiotic biosynthesis monooxygenase (ABM) superfamily enzyme
MEAAMIARIWHGWTRPERAQAYETLLRGEIFAGIKARGLPGFRDIQLLRRPLGAEVEFVTIMHFDTLDDIRHFAGEDPEACVVPDKARAILSRFDLRSQHYEVRDSPSSVRAEGRPGQ